jgi:hypothetical protein
MSTKWILINVVLLAICAALGWQLRAAIERFRAENQISAVQPRDSKLKAGQEPAIPAPAAPKAYVTADFDVVPNKNLFSEYRAREEKVETPVVIETPPLTVKPVLVGITLMGNQRLAAIVDPSSQSAGRKTQTRKVGDSFQGYIVTDITETTMVLESGTRREVIPLYDTSKRGQPGGKTPIVATRVVSFGAGAGGASGMQAGASPAPSSLPASAAQARRGVVDGPPPQPGSSPGVVGTSGGAVRTTQGSQTTTPGRSTTGTQAPAWNEGTDTQGRRVIRTPFGDIVRDKPPSP